MLKNLSRTLAAFIAGLALLGGVGLSGIPAAAADVTPTGPTGTWNLAFDDEFSTTTLDATKWSTGWYGSGITGTANTAEKSCHNPENVWQSKGVLKLRAKTQQERCGNLTQSYSTALINTNGKFSFGYGYAEARIYVPSANDDSIANWPAWWTVGQAPWPNTGENDIFEGLGGHAEANYHSLVNGAHASEGGPITNKSYIGWHTFGADRQAGVTKYYYDGTLVKTVNVGTSDPHFLVLNNTIGDYGGALGVPSTLQVDYVRVWTKAAASVATPGAILNIGPGSGQNHFSVQTAPVGATEVQTHTQAEIAAGYSETPVFVTSTDGKSVSMSARMDAATTSANTAYARSELRELGTDGSNYGFNYASGTHYIRGTTKVTHLPPNKPSVMIAQVHDASDDRLAIKTVLNAGVLQVVGTVNGLAVTPKLDTSYVVGESFDWMIKIVNGTGYIYFNDMTTPAITTTALTPSSTGGADWYFKAGNYNLSNETIDSPTEYMSVELSKLQHWHTGWPTPQPIVGATATPTPTPTPTTTPTAGSYPLAGEYPNQPTYSAFGHDWYSRDDDFRSGGPGLGDNWERNNVVKNSDGTVTLNITNPTGNSPVASEMVSREAFGYGRYTVKAEGNFASLNRAYVFGIFTFDWSATAVAPGYNEIDLSEVSTWGSTDPVSSTSTYYPDAGGLVTIGESPWPSTTTKATFVLDWSAGKVVVKITDSVTGAVIASYTKTGTNVPTPKKEAVHINLWDGQWGGLPVNSQQAPATSFKVTDFSHSKTIPGSTTTPTPTPTPTPTTPPTSGTAYPLHTNIVATTFWVGEIFNASLSDGSQVCSTYDSQWAFSHTGINKWASTDEGCNGSPVGGCDGPSSGTTYATFKCTTETRTAANDYFPKTQPLPKENPFYLDLPYDDLNDATAFKERCTVIPWAVADNTATGKNNCTNSSYSYMKNRWVKITGPNGKTCYGQNEDAGPSSGSLYHDKAYVFGSNDPRPRNTQFSGDPTQGAGMDVSPALNGCLGFASLDGDTDKIKWQWVDRASVPAGPWTKVITTSQVRN